MRIFVLRRSEAREKRMRKEREDDDEERSRETQRDTQTGYVFSADALCLCLCLRLCRMRCTASSLANGLRIFGLLLPRLFPISPLLFSNLFLSSVPSRCCVAELLFWLDFAIINKKRRSRRDSSREWRRESEQRSMSQRRKSREGKRERGHRQKEESEKSNLHKTPLSSLLHRRVRR